MHWPWHTWWIMHSGTFPLVLSVQSMYEPSCGHLWNFQYFHHSNLFTVLLNYSVTMLSFLKHVILCLWLTNSWYLKMHSVWMTPGGWCLQIWQNIWRALHVLSWSCWCGLWILSPAAERWKQNRVILKFQIVKLI